MFLELVVNVAVWMLFAHVFAWLISLSASKGDQRAKVYRRWRMGCVPTALFLAIGAALRHL